MIHGMGFRDHKHLNYWGRIPQSLIKNGATVFFGHQDSNGSVENNAQQIALEIDMVLKETGSQKLNLIAHSKGGLEARYIISTLGYADAIASLTTISTPHNGSLTVDKLMHFPNWLIRSGCFFADLWFRLLGDKHPETYKAITIFKTDAAEAFNIKNPDNEQVFYQSYAFIMKNIFSDILMWLPYLVVKNHEGDNDGLLAPRATQWTNFKGIYTGAKRRGISHCDEVDLRRHIFSKKINENISDITDLYIDIVNNLKLMGL